MCNKYKELPVFTRCRPETTFDEDIGPALRKAYDWDSDSDPMLLAHAAQIVLHHMFDDGRLYDDPFKTRCQEKSVLNILWAFVNMVLEGPSIKDQSYTSTSPGILSIAQLLNFNAVKHK
ncbi:uncharacterized protein [Macrobrachium rosenbergii]|uniref:uncharacterized protein n=1 Tax=Macrobrachium rosenbergii TaxID=79674 RepID=UPI0034D4A9BA